jgi:H+/Cl- antiporter ClcA
MHPKPEGWLSLLPYALLLLSRAPIALGVVKSSRKMSFIQALGFGSCGSKFGQYGRLYIGVLALSQRGFDREAVLILHSGSDTLQLGLIERG